MRVELVEHSFNGILNELCLVNLVYVHVVNQIFGNLQLAHVRSVAVVRDYLSLLCHHGIGGKH